MIADKASDLIRRRKPPEAVRLPAAPVAVCSGRDTASQC